MYAIRPPHSPSETSTRAAGTWPERRGETACRVSAGAKARLWSPTNTRRVNLSPGCNYGLHAVFLLPPIPFANVVFRARASCPFFHTDTPRAILSETRGNVGAPEIARYYDGRCRNSPARPTYSPPAGRVSVDRFRSNGPCRFVFPTSPLVVVTECFRLDNDIFSLTYIFDLLRIFLFHNTHTTEHECNDLLHSDTMLLARLKI